VRHEAEAGTGGGAVVWALRLQKQGFKRVFLFDSTPPRLYYTAPMSRDRAQELEVAALVARAAPVDFEIGLDELTRIAPLLARAGGVASGQFRFHRFVDSGPGAAFDAADGLVSAHLVLTCQRCLGDMDFEIAEHCALAFVEDEATAADVPATHDPVVMRQGRVALDELVEEQLLLALPLVAMHADASVCKRRLAASLQGEAAKPHEPKQRPFAGLRDLMKK
jgi:uncharacterized protein